MYPVRGTPATLVDAGTIVVTKPMSIPTRDLAFHVEMILANGTILNGTTVVGQATGRVVLPIRATFMTIPPPGAYGLHLPPEHMNPEEFIIETMGWIDASALVATLQIPSSWQIIPEELVERLTLQGELAFEAVTADEEYRLNEPSDIDLARQRFEGRWSLAIPFPLGFSFSRDETQLSLDRRDYELKGDFAQMTRI